MGNSDTMPISNKREKGGVLNITEEQWNDIRTDVDMLKDALSKGIGAVKAIAWLLGFQLAAVVGIGGLILSYIKQ